MGIRQYILLVFSVSLFSCGVKKVEQNIEEKKELTSNPDASKAALIFSENILKKNIRIQFHERAISNYLDIQMIFETDELISYTSYSNKLYEDNSAQSNYDGFILFVATYKNSKSAEYAFNELKTNTKTRISELEGFSGLLVEQVQVFERIRKHGGVITQKGKYVFYLVETCGEPPIGDNWKDYENLFLEFITEKNEEIQVLNADCGMDKFTIKNIKASR